MKNTSLILVIVLSGLSHCSYAQNLDFDKLETEYNTRIESVNALKQNNIDSALTILYGMVDEYYVFPDLFFHIANASADKGDFAGACSSAFLAKELGSSLGEKSFKKNKCKNDPSSWIEALSRFKSSKSGTIISLEVKSGATDLKQLFQVNVGQQYTLNEGKQKTLVTLERIEQYPFGHGILFKTQNNTSLIKLSNSFGDDCRIDSVKQ